MCPGMRVSQLLNIAFDFSAWEILGALYNGATLCLQGNTKKERFELMKSVNIVLGTPSMLACYEPEAHPNIKQMMIGGEIVPQGTSQYVFPFVTSMPTQTLSFGG
jgi:non-ribosomal peptide synthetase component F